MNPKRRYDPTTKHQVPDSRFWDFCGPSPREHLAGRPLPGESVSAVEIANCRVNLGTVPLKPPQWVTSQVKMSRPPGLFRNGTKRLAGYLLTSSRNAEVNDLGVKAIIGCSAIRLDPLDQHCRYLKVQGIFPAIDPPSIVLTIFSMINSSIEPGGNPLNAYSSAGNGTASILLPYPDSPPVFPGGTTSQVMFLLYLVYSSRLTYCPSMLRPHLGTYNQHYDRSQCSTTTSPPVVRNQPPYYGYGSTEYPNDNGISESSTPRSDFIPSHSFTMSHSNTHPIYPSHPGQGAFPNPSLPYTLIPNRTPRSSTLQGLPSEGPSVAGSQAYSYPINHDEMQRWNPRSVDSTPNNSAPAQWHYGIVSAPPREGASTDVPPPPLRPQVGSQAITLASLSTRKKKPIYFCNVPGCTSRGFTTKHGFEYCQITNGPTEISDPTSVLIVRADLGRDLTC
ncbi:hypothetical protein L218DRAFT_1062715 [Marasmius fiardii PR-910]|nr:hypothetical protein L218DRAFT_1062715 [Marasmius fiardii PR-910]